MGGGGGGRGRGGEELFYGDDSEAIDIGQMLVLMPYPRDQQGHITKQEVSLRKIIVDGYRPVGS